MKLKPGEASKHFERTKKRAEDAKDVPGVGDHAYSTSMKVLHVTYYQVAVYQGDMTFLLTGPATPDKQVAFARQVVKEL